jgi:hypothetical protein
MSSKEVVEATPQVEDPFEFTLKGPGLAFSRHVSQPVALQLIAIAMGPQGQAAFAPHLAQKFYPPNATAAVSGAQRLSLREFMDHINARKIPEKILAIAAHLIDGVRKTTVSREEIKNSFRLAGEPVPTNLPRDFANTLSLGWIAADHVDPSMFYVTRKGEQALEARFEVDTTPPRSRRRRAGGGGNDEPAEQQLPDKEKS